MGTAGRPHAGLGAGLGTDRKCLNWATEWSVSVTRLRSGEGRWEAAAAGGRRSGEAGAGRGPPARGLGAAAAVRQSRPSAPSSVGSARVVGPWAGAEARGGVGDCSEGRSRGAADEGLAPQSGRLRE